MNHRAPLFLLLLSFFVFSCGTENEPTYTLTTTVSPSEGGTISPSEGEFTEGEQITLTGNPSDGWVFSRWEGDWIGTSNSVNITIYKNYNIIGLFQRRDYPLNITIEGEGMVTETIVSQPTTSYTYETIVELTPNPSVGWRFVGWSGDLDGNESPKQVTIDGETNVVVKFERRDYPLNITIEGEGTVTETIVSQPTTEYSYETIVELTPNPSEGWRFIGWGGDLSGSESPQQITIDGEKNVVVKFERRDYPLNITIEGEGTVTETIISQPTTDYTYETIVELTPNPSFGWEFVEWGGDLSGSESPQQITIDGEKNVVVSFTRIPFYLGENGITVMCPETEVGDKGMINGIEYESVDRELLIQRRDEGEDLTIVCVSNVTDMSWMFFESPFNQPIENWDVSNVTNMYAMFAYSSFNQPIGNWDVRNVTDMIFMFRDSQFNQAIENWDVSNVTNMYAMFAYSPFNQPIGNWDVRNVTNMGAMFFESPFNQPIENWDVSNVTNMYAMFYYSPFNQPIGNWDASNVTDMSFMFYRSPFNQPIGNWDVRNVTDMSFMFYGSQFNQPINGWCVSQIPTEPENFSFGSPLFEGFKPIWGTCPD